MKLVIYLILLQLLPNGIKGRIPNSPLLTLIKEANNSCVFYDLGKKRNDGLVLCKDDISSIVQELHRDGFLFNSERDTVLLHIGYTSFLQIKGRISAYIDAYSSLSESHLLFERGERIIIVPELNKEQGQSYNDADIIERIIRNDPELFLSIYEEFGEPMMLDAVDDRAIRIEVQNGKITSLDGWVYAIGPLFWWDGWSKKYSQQARL